MADFIHLAHWAIIIVSLGSSVFYTGYRDFFVEKMRCGHIQSHIITISMLAVIIVVGLNSIHDLLVSRSAYISLPNIVAHFTRDSEIVTPSPHPRTPVIPPESQRSDIPSTIMPQPLQGYAQQYSPAVEKIPQEQIRKKWIDQLSR